MRQLSLAASGVAILVAMCAPATAQRAGEPNPRYLERQKPQQWKLTTDVTIRAFDNKYQRPSGGELVQDTWRFDQASIVYPMPRSSASHQLDERRSNGYVELSDVKVAEQHRLADYPARSTYAIWEVKAPEGTEVVTREMELHVEHFLSSYETVFHEEAALEVDWPKGEWPTALKSTFEPMPFIDHKPGEGPYDMADVQRLLDQWTGGQDPRQVKPVALAKWIAGNIAQHVQPSGEGLNFNRQGEFEGVHVAPPSETARRGRGTQVDMAVLLVQMYREAGLPARLVLGYGLENEKDAKLDFLKGSTKYSLRAWAEFALYDERDGTVTWVPVDVFRMRKSSGSRMPRNYMERPQKFFGTHDELDVVAPFSFHLFPPTTVRSYGGGQTPAFWGWFVAPAAPDRAFQGLRFGLTTPPKGPQDVQRR